MEIHPVLMKAPSATHTEHNYSNGDEVGSDDFTKQLSRVAIMSMGQPMSPNFLLVNGSGLTRETQVANEKNTINKILILVPKNMRL